MNLLVLAALTEATGNRELARRLADHLATVHHVVVVDSTHTSVQELRELVAAEKIEAALGVHALLAGPFLHLLGIPYALIFGGTDLYEPTHVLHQKQMARAVLGARQLIAFSNENRRRAEWVWPAIRGRVRLLAQSAGTLEPAPGFSLRQQLRLRSDDFLVLLPTGIRCVKDPLHVIAAFSRWYASRAPAEFQAQDRRRRAELVLAGAVLEPDYAEGALAEIQTAPGVHYLGALLRPQMLAAIAEADMVINTSLSEGMCCALLEAMSLGTPIVARKNAGNESLVTHGHTGLLYDEPEECVNWLKSLIASSGLCERLATAGERRIEAVHSAERERQTYLTIMTEVSDDSLRLPPLGSDVLPDDLELVAPTAIKLSMPPPVVDALYQLIARVHADARLHSGVRELVGLLASAPPAVAIAQIAEQRFDALSVADTRQLNLALALTQVSAAATRLSERGVDTDTVWSTFSDLTEWATFYWSNGHGGITLDVLAWAQRYLRGELLRIGRLLFDLEPFSSPLRVYRHRQTQALSAVTLSGQALDLVHGVVRTGRAPGHDASIWEMVLEAGSPVLQMWFPGPAAKPTTHEMLNSIRTAYTLFARLSEETVPVAVCGESWRLDPQLQAILPFDESVQGLARLCHLFPSALSEAATLRRLFGPETDRSQLYALPRDGLDPVRGAMAAFLDTPENHLKARGGFVLQDELRNFAEWQ